MLAEDMRLHPGLLLTCVELLKDEASEEDIRVLWDALDTDLETEKWVSILLRIMEAGMLLGGWTR